MNKITKQVLEKYLDENGKIYLPDFCERVLFDIGTSYNAPHSQVWTKETKDVCVFAFVSYTTIQHTTGGRVLET